MNSPSAIKLQKFTAFLNAKKYLRLKQSSTTALYYKPTSISHNNRVLPPIDTIVANCNGNLFNKWRKKCKTKYVAIKVKSKITVEQPIYIGEIRTINFRINDENAFIHVKSVYIRETFSHDEIPNKIRYLWKIYQFCIYRPTLRAFKIRVVMNKRFAFYTMLRNEYVDNLMKRYTVDEVMRIGCAINKLKMLSPIETVIENPKSLWFGTSILGNLHNIGFITLEAIPQKRNRLKNFASKNCRILTHRLSLAENLAMVMIS